jgi:hypothetical protein
MLTLDEMRKKYPQLNEFSDAELERIRSLARLFLNFWSRQKRFEEEAGRSLTEHRREE